MQVSFWFSHGDDSSLSGNGNLGDAAFCCSYSVDSEPARHRMEWECCFAPGMTFVHLFNCCAMWITLPPEVI
jgi:hypothetical protein